MKRLTLHRRIRTAASLVAALLVEFAAGDLVAQTPGSFTEGEATFGIVRDGARVAITKSGAWVWNSGAWRRDDALMAGLDAVPAEGRQLRDFDKDGVCELLASHDIFIWNTKSRPGSLLAMRSRRTARCSMRKDATMACDSPTSMATALTM